MVGIGLGALFPWSFYLLPQKGIEGMIAEDVAAAIFVTPATLSVLGLCWMQGHQGCRKGISRASWVLESILLQSVVWERSKAGRKSGFFLPFPLSRFVPLSVCCSRSSVQDLRHDSASHCDEVCMSGRCTENRWKRVSESFDNKGGKQRRWCCECKSGGGKNPQGADLLYFLIFVFTFLLLAALL